MEGGAQNLQDMKQWCLKVKGTLTGDGSQGGFKPENLNSTSAARRGKEINRPSELMLTESIKENKQSHLQLSQGKRNTRERMAYQ